MTRPAIRTVADLASLDMEEVLEGYRDGFSGEPDPGDNRSDSYWHGHRNGRNDRVGRVDDDQRALAADLLETRGREEEDSARRS